MRNPKRLSFVVPIVLLLMGCFAPTWALAQGWPQQVAMWHPPQWPGYGSPMHDGYWGARQEAAPQEAPRNAPERRAAKQPPRHNAAGNPAGLSRSAARQSKQKTFRKRGVASWYGRRFHGRKTASGERYNMYAMTAAHRTLPLPSYVRVSNPANGASVVVLVNDRGPYVGNRIIDLSYAAASALGFVKKGTMTVELEVIPNALPTIAAAPGARPADGTAAVASIAAAGTAAD